MLEGNPLTISNFRKLLYMTLLVATRKFKGCGDNQRSMGLRIRHLAGHQLFRFAWTDEANGMRPGDVIAPWQGKMGRQCWCLC